MLVKVKFKLLNVVFNVQIIISMNMNPGLYRRQDMFVPSRKCSYQGSI